MRNLVICSFLSLVLLLPSLGYAGGAPVDGLKSYRVWKSEKVQTALSQVLSSRELLLKAKAFQGKDIENLQRQLSQLEWNLEVAKDLSVTDYFALYLSQSTSRDRFKTAAGKFTPQEVAELMEAYANALGLNPTESAGKLDPLAGPAPLANPLTKLPSQATFGADQIK